MARDALDPKQIATMARNLPADLNGEVVQPVVQEVLYETLERYTVREIFASKRQEISQALEPEFKLCPAADGVVRQSVTIGNLDLPRDCKAGMENLLFEGLAIEEMRYTLELKEMQVKQSGLAAEAERSRRERQSEAAAQVRRIEAAGGLDAARQVARAPGEAGNATDDPGLDDQPASMMDSNIAPTNQETRVATALRVLLTLRALPRSTIW